MAVVINGTTGIDKVQDDSVDIADLSATGSPSSSTYLRGDNSWATAGGATSIDGLSDATVYNTTTIGLGSGALDSMSSGNGRNTAVGYNALTANTSGYNNTAVGHLAGTAITDGYQNTILGDRAGTAITTGDNNTALGQHALKSATTADGNTAVGFDCMAGNTSGANNTAIGIYALDAVNTGDSNIAIGHTAMTTNTSGHECVAIGRSAMYNNTTGADNVAVGYAAMDSNTTAGYNTAIGHSALKTNTTGNSNVGVGYHAAVTATTGSKNTIVGMDAGKYTTGAYNTVLGQEAGNSLGQGNTNTCIGYRAGKSIAGDGGAGGVDNICIGAGAGFDTNAITGGRWNIIIGNWARGQGGNYEAETVIGYNVAGGAENRFTFGINTNDTACSFGSTSWSAPSDERYKKDIVTSTAGLSFVNDLRPVTHKWKNEGDLPSDHNAYVEGSTNVYNNATKTYHGFVAQEVKTAIDAHSEIKDGFDLWDVDGDGRQRIADGALMPILVKAIQELSAQNTALAARITTLEG